MKKYLYSLLSAAAMLGFTSCDGTQEEPHIQWFPEVTLEGEDTYYLEIGEDFTLPGYSAINTLTDEDVTSLVDVQIYNVVEGEYVDDISTASPCLYNVYYMCPASEVELASDVRVYKQRDIYVYDPEIDVDIAGSYEVNMTESIYEYTGRTFAYYAKYYEDDNDGLGFCTIDVTQLAPGLFYVSDLLGGWYDQIRGYNAYGSGLYNMAGYISLNSDNTFTLLSSYVSAWGDSLDWLDDGYYDEDTQTISYEAQYIDWLGVYIVMTNANAE